MDTCTVAPEFPTGNGKVDLHLRCGTKHGIIEAKSFRSQGQLARGVAQAAVYARKLSLPSITLAVFVPLDDETILDQLS
jgi:hypothetical protein